MSTIGVIGGGGWLAGTLLRPALAAGAIRPEDLILSSRSGRVRGFDAWPAIRMTADNATLAEQCGIVILSVRPADLDAIHLDLRDRLVISVMASVTAESLVVRFGAGRIVRAMPNALAEERLSFTPWHGGANLTDSDIAFVDGLFGASGKAVRIEHEDQLDYFTALTGSGPAFPALFTDIMIRHAIGAGIPPEIAEAAVRQLMAGAGRHLAASAESPGAIAKSFLDYRGTTAAGLQAMLDRGIEATIGAGLDAAHAKARGQ